MALTPALASAQETPAPARPQAPPAPPDVAAPPPDAVKTASGMFHKVVQPGTGTTKPGPTDVVTVLYSGWTADGKCFDSSILRNNRPSTFPLNNVLAGWSEGVQMMVVGEKRRLWVPEALAFKGAAGKPAGLVVFDIELVEFKPSPTAAPPDVAGVPADAKKTGSGLAYRVLKPGTGAKHPGQFNTVTVHYTGWTTDGKMFDSSLPGGKPASFPLDKVIKGWTEGVQLMVEGEKTRFWIPRNLAYGDNPQGNVPRGMLVFDIELISIDK
jgi:peptidylprolyl isomerase